MCVLLMNSSVLLYGKYNLLSIDSVVRQPDVLWSIKAIT